MKKIAIILFGLIGLFGAWLIKKDGSDNLVNKPVFVEKQFDAEFDKFSMSEIEHTIYEHGRKTFIFSCEELVHGKRKFGPITVNPIKEIQMLKVRIEVIQDDSPKQDTDVDSLTSQPPIISKSLNKALKKILTNRDLGSISRVVMSNFTLNVSRNGGKHFTVRADTVRMGVKSSQAKFDHGFSIVTKTAEELSSKEAIWKGEKNAFYIPTDFRIKNAEGEYRSSKSLVTVNSAGKIIEIKRDAR